MRALITGATGGMGQAFAMLLAKQGVDLVLTGRNVENLKRMQNNLHTDVQIIPADLSNIAECYDLYEKLKQNNIDIVINNAGVGVVGMFWETDCKKELDMLALNVQAVHILTKLFLKDFRKRNHGYILNVASSAGFAAGPCMASYYAGKSYVLRLTQAIAEELRQEKSRVRVCVLCAGPVDTDFNRNAAAVSAVKGISPQKAAKEGLKGLFVGKTVILPDSTTKLVYIMQKYMPMHIVTACNYHIQKRKRG